MSQSPPLQWFSLTDGRQFAWREWGTGDPLVMLHGWSMSSLVFAEVAEPLAAHFRVLCPDLPGHGGSASASETSLSAFAKILAEWASALKLPPVNLLGWSLGGQVAMQVAAEKSLPLRHLLLVASTPRFCQTVGWTHALPATQIKALDRNLARAYEKTMGDFFRLQFSGEIMAKDRYRQILQFAVRSSTLPDPDAARQLLQVLANSDQRYLLPGIDVPTQVLHGEIDQIIPPAAGRFLAEMIADATFESFAAVGHAPFFSRPADCVRCWLDYLR